jgi:hypothetical protein
VNVFNVWCCAKFSGRDKNATKDAAVAELLGPFELELRIMLLPPISRGANLDGPAIQAQRLVEKVWQVASNDGVPLVEAFRQLGAEEVEGAIWRTLATGEYPGDPRHWVFPGLEDLLPELRKAAWQNMLAGALLTKAIKGVRGKRHRTVLPAELVRLAPDWEASRLTLGRIDEFIDVRVQRLPAELVKKAWGKKPDKAAVAAAAKETAREYSPDAPPTEREWWDKLKARLGDGVTREIERDALKTYAPHLRGSPGRRSTTPR